MIAVLIILCMLLVAYLIAIMPRMMGRPDYTPLMGHYYAHRGLHDNETDAPENSMQPFGKRWMPDMGLSLTCS